MTQPHDANPPHDSSALSPGSSWSRLVLVRHGIAQERERPDLDDDYRALTDRGARRVIEAAHGLARLKVKPRLILTSPLIRSRQTAELIAQVLGRRDRVAVVEWLKPQVEPRDLAGALNAQEVETLLAVGHNPNLSLCLRFLTQPEAEPAATTPLAMLGKASAACLVRRPSHGPAQLKWLVSARMLRILGR